VDWPDQEWERVVTMKTTLHERVSEQHDLLGGFQAPPDDGADQQCQTAAVGRTPL
jgi:hypothetical protein